jgi:hypothetical protein
MIIQNLTKISNTIQTNMMHRKFMLDMTIKANGWNDSASAIAHKKCHLEYPLLF